MDFVTTALINGKIFSPDLDGNVITGDTVLIKEEKIFKVGTYEDLKECIADDTEVIDCEGNTILPGLCDAHCHPSIAASAYSGCDLFGIYIQEGETEDEVIDQYMTRLKKFIDENPGDDLIRGTGWVMGNFQGERIPTRHDIDKICSDRPVVLESFCQHNLWVNTKAMELAGVDENTPDVYAGKIYREESGFPQGIFNDPEAMEVIKMNVPGYDYSVEKYKEALLYYQTNLANKYGVMLVQDCMHSDNARQAFKELADEGKLTLRIRGTYLIEPGKSAEQLPKAIERKGTDNSGDDFRIDTIKMFAEGLFTLVEPFEEQFIKDNELPEGFCGELYWSDEEFISTAKTAMDAGFSVHVHAMGDNTVRQSADCLAKAQNAHFAEGIDEKQPIPEEAPRNVIAHLMLVQDVDSKVMGENNIIGNCQPRWMVHDSDIDAMYYMMGEERATSAYPYRKLREDGVRVAFGTDFPVTPPPDTMHEIQCAMTRTVFPNVLDYEKHKGKVLGTERPATLAEAVQSLSINGAYQMFADEFTGSIEEGKSADMVIMDADLETIDVNKIYAVQAAKTIFKGKVVYEK